MMILETTQIIFNIVFSLAIIIITTLICAMMYDAIKFINLIKKFIMGVEKESEEIYNKLNNFVETILKLSFVSRLFNKKEKKNKK